MIFFPMMVDDSHQRYTLNGSTKAHGTGDPLTFPPSYFEAMTMGVGPAYNRLMLSLVNRGRESVVFKFNRPASAYVVIHDYCIPLDILDVCGQKIICPCCKRGALSDARITLCKNAVRKLWSDEYGEEEEPRLLFIGLDESDDPDHEFDARSQHVYYFDSPAFSYRFPIVAVDCKTETLVSGIYESV